MVLMVLLPRVCSEGVAIDARPRGAVIGLVNSARLVGVAIDVMELIA